MKLSPLNLTEVIHLSDFYLLPNVHKMSSWSKMKRWKEEVYWEGQTSSTQLSFTWINNVYFKSSNHCWWTTAAPFFSYRQVNLIMKSLRTAFNISISFTQDCCCIYFMLYGEATRSVCLLSLFPPPIHKTRIIQDSAFPLAFIILLKPSNTEDFTEN